MQVREIGAEMNQNIPVLRTTVSDIPESLGMILKSESTAFIESSR